MDVPVICSKKDCSPAVCPRGLRLPIGRPPLSRPHNCPSSRVAHVDYFFLQPVYGDSPDGEHRICGVGGCVNRVKLLSLSLRI